MVNFKILEQHGSDRKKLAAIFTQHNSSDLSMNGVYLLEQKVQELEEKQGKPVSTKQKTKISQAIARTLYERRKKWIDGIRTRTQEGRARFTRDFRHYMTCDLALDNRSENLPLHHLATGKLDVRLDDSEIKDLETKYEVKLDKYIEKSDDGIKRLNLPRLYESHFSVAKPVITRMTAEQSARTNSLYPFLKYDPRAKSKATERLRADVMSQRAELIVDAHGWRSMNTQLIRRMFMYSAVVGFVDQGWKIEKTLLNEGENARVAREGFRIISPHPTCIFYDDAYPLSSLNYDNGLGYIGYWHACRAGEIINNPGYWNRDQLPYRKGQGSITESLNSLSGLNYICPEALSVSTLCNGDTVNGVLPLDNPRVSGLVRMFEENDRQSMLGFYSSDHPQSAMVITHFFDRVIPQQVGFGTYPYPVWVKLSVINDDIVINAEVLPSRPGAVMSYNVNDSRLTNGSLLHDVLPYEDQIKMLVGQMLWMMKLQSLVVIAINTDIISDDTVLNKIIEHIEGGKYYSAVGTLPYSLSGLDRKLLAQRGNSNIMQALEAITVNLHAEINQLSQTIAFIQGMMERNLLLSPQQLAQLVTKETNATEIASVDKTTSIMADFQGEGIEEFWAAMKVIVYEGTVSRGSNRVEVPIVETYAEDVMKEAGFERTDGNEGNTQEGMTVIGDRKMLVGNYVYSSRDKSERAVDSETAISMFQLLQALLGSELLVQKFGPQQLATAMSEVFRLSGSAFKLEVLPEDQQEVTRADQILQALQQLAQRIESLEQADAQTDEVLGNLQQIITTLTQPNTTNPNA